MGIALYLSANFQTKGNLMKKKAIFAALAAGALAGQGVSASPEKFLESVESAHNADAWYDAAGIRTDVKVVFGGATRINGTMTFDCWLGKARIDQYDGRSVVFDGDTAWVSPASADFPRARFDVITWPYFLAAPMKLGDPGANLSEHKTLPMRGGDAQETMKLTFGDGVGDAPDDWYIVFANDDGVVEALAYIITYGGSDPEEAKPSIILYSDYQVVDGVPIPMRWDFYYWDEEKGVYGEPKGYAELSNPALLTELPEGLFEKPLDAKKDELPK